MKIKKKKSELSRSRKKNLVCQDRRKSENYSEKRKNRWARSEKKFRKCIKILQISLFFGQHRILNLLSMVQD